jgi:hypothetical protein
MTPEKLTAYAVAHASEAQKPKLDAMLAMGWHVTKTVTVDGVGTAISLATAKAVCWLTPSGRVERPTNRGNCKISGRTLERVYSGR